MIWSHKSKRDGLTYWHIRYDRPDGRTKKETLPPVLDAEGKVARQATKQDARDLLIKRKAEVNAGTWRDPDAPPEPAIEPDRGPTFAKFAERFLTDHPGRRRSNHYPSNVGELVKHFGARHLREISRADVDAYRAILETTARRGRPLPKRITKATGQTHAARAPLSATTVLKRLRTLHRMFRIAVRWGEVGSNPVADTAKPSPNAGRTRFLTPQEFESIEAAAPPWLRPMMRLAVATGMRLKEVATLRWENVDLASGILFVSQETKTGTRPIPLGREAKVILEARRDKRKEIARETGSLGVYVFVDDAGGDYAEDVRRKIVSEETRAAAIAAGFGPGVGFHVLRHTAAAWMAQAGVPLYEVQRILGHSTPALTQRYAHLQPEHLARAVAALDFTLGGPEKGTRDNPPAPAGPISVPHSAGRAVESRKTLTGGASGRS